ncbi:unnamed protein product, partial [Vitis vinifera]
MAAQKPVEIGTRGTVGSLIMQEIEYFSRLEIGRKDCSQKPQCKIADAISSDSNQPNGISGFTYRNLKADVKKLQL